MSSSALDPDLDWDDSDDTRTLLDHTAAMSTKSASGAQHGTAQQRKMALVADALEKTGMGRYQWAIFCLCGFGYTLDLMWAQAFSLIAPRIQIELGIPNAQYGDIFSLFHAGLTIGALTWGVLVDILGRRVAFNATVGMTAVFGLVIGSLESWTAILTVVFFVGFGLGGNIPIDATIVMEFIPKKNRYLLAALSAFQPLGVIITALISWALVPRYACPFSTPAGSCKFTAPGAACCTKASNYGWRYAVFTLGAISLAAFVARFFLFTFRESPRFLIAHGRDAEAVRVVHEVASFNHLSSSLSLQQLEACDAEEFERRGSDATLNGNGEDPVVGGRLRGGVQGKVVDGVREAGNHLRELFDGWTMARLTVLTWVVYGADYWAFSIAGAFLPKLLAERGAAAHFSTAQTYRNYIYTSLPGLPGVALGASLIEVKALGRRWAMVITAALMGAAMVSFVGVRSPQAGVGFNAMEYFFQSAFNAILYGWTPEAFPARVRGTASGLASCAGRLASIVSPIVAAHVLSDGKGAATAIYIGAGGAFLASVLCVGLRETRGVEDADSGEREGDGSSVECS
ncbi:MFS general substrate transporter [Exidia glandulosa HHB12029]|uniref:MFS general substrate transporter n=1 Tax=Exidia glandulosa HHB12029 TaxID=1314781 RepID=A0A166NHN7_EXIGL|nr:MFS general substrate transporter [Exidia glandulosa HHB12029]